MKIELLKTPQPYKSFELMELLLHSFTPKTNMMIIYRPPPSSNNQLTLSLFFDEFSQLLERSVSSPGQLLLCGDFNFHAEDPSDHNTRKFLDLLHCFNLDVYNDHSSTHKDNHKLDLVIGRSDENLVADSHVHDPIISDHFAIHCKLNSDRPPNPKKTVSYRKLRSVNTDAFRQDILSSELLSTNSSDLTSLCSRYDDVISAIVDKHAPLVTKTITVRPNSPWYTDDIGVEKSTRRRLERRWRRTLLPEHRLAYVAQCKLVKGLVLNAKTKYYSNLISESSSNSKALFQTIDQLLHRKPETRLPYAPSPLHLANQFGDFFHLKISNIRDELLPVEVPAYFSSLDTIPIVCHLDTLTPVTIEELSKIAPVVGSKSCTIDPIPASLLRENLDLLLPILCQIVNLSLESGCVPHSLKQAILKPLLKKASLDHEILSNFRPISNLKFVAKLIGKVVANRLVSYLEQNHLDEPLQSAYKKFHSCETALVRVQNDMLCAIDKRCTVALLLLDLSAAFDTVDHNILLQRLHSRFSVRGKALDWFASYLADRTQSVVINNNKSKPYPLECGVPQGSILGPILYLLYTSPLADILKHHNMLPSLRR